MSFEIKAVYENGVLRPDRPLPLEEHQQVRVMVETETSIARRSYGIIGWKGDPEVVRRIALDPEFGVAEHGLTQLASRDADFDGIPGISRFGPA